MVHERDLIHLWAKQTTKGRVFRVIPRQSPRFILAKSHNSQQSEKCLLVSSEVMSDFAKIYGFIIIF